MDLSLSKEFLDSHIKNCWSEFKSFKKTKDKIVFFIGTLFISVSFGSGYLISKAIEPDTSAIMSDLITRLYVVQYILMHLFFFLLFLYYTYNNILEKIFLIESQCAQYKLRTQYKEFSSNIIIPFSMIKRCYGDGIGNGPWLKIRYFKDASNTIMIFVYTLFSTIPLFFRSDFIFTDPLNKSTGIKLNFSWIFAGCIAIILLLLVVIASKKVIEYIRGEIRKKWDMPKTEYWGV